MVLWLLAAFRSLMAEALRFLTASRAPMVLWLPRRPRGLMVVLWLLTAFRRLMTAEVPRPQQNLRARRRTHNGRMWRAPCRGRHGCPGPGPGARWPSPELL
jgi:hypothetical protein